MVLYNLYKKQGILGSVFPFLFILDIADWRLSLDAGNVTYLLVNLDVFACVSYRMGIAEVHLLVLLWGLELIFVKDLERYLAQMCLLNKIFEYIYQWDSLRRSCKCITENHTGWESRATTLVQNQEQLTRILTQPGWALIHGSSFESNILDNFLCHIRDSVSPSFALNCRKLAISNNLCCWSPSTWLKIEPRQPQGKQTLIRECKAFVCAAV